MFYTKELGKKIAERFREKHVTQKMKVTMFDGTRLVVCCGPAVTMLGRDMVAYEPIGKAERGMCCHYKTSGGKRLKAEQDERKRWMEGK